MKILILSSIILIIALSVMNNREYLKPILPSLVILIPIITFNCFTDQIFKIDYEKGILDFLIMTNDPGRIIVYKFLSISMLSYFTVIIASILSMVLYNFEIYLTMNIIIASLPVVIISSIIFVNLSIMNVYFENRSNLISSIVIPFIFPSLIVFGLFIESSNFSYFYILVGLDFIIFPICFYLSKILLTDIY